jgi:2,4-dienoyl-CoA reductase (NADPH2)
MVQMARPFLADAFWVNKTATNRVDEINTCIACNQACLDHTFKNQRATCLVNPRAAFETELVYMKTKNQNVLRLWVVVLQGCQLQQLQPVVDMR